MPAIPKPTRRGPKPKKFIVRRTRVRKVSQKQRARIKERTEVTRPYVLAADRYKCRACPRPCPRRVTYRTKIDAQGNPIFWWLEVNEHPMRSKGGKMDDPRDCITLCADTAGNGCHQRYHKGTLKIRTLDPDRRCRAVVEFTEGSRTWQG